MSAVLLAVFGVTASPASAAGATHGGHSAATVLSVWAGDSNHGTTDYYRLSTHRLRAGLVAVKLHNVGTVAHQVQLIRLHKGITAAKFEADLIASQGGSALAEGDAAGGSNAVEPGGYQETWTDLQGGSYVALCFQTGGDMGAPHFAHGMFTSFTVVGHTRVTRAPAHVRGTIKAYSFNFAVPYRVDGDDIYRFVNTSRSDTHELTILKLLPGKTAADVLAWVRSGQTAPPPVSGAAGGAGAIPPGGQMWLRMNLRPGRYVAVCFVPDDMPPHLPHAAMGMIREFTAVG